MLYLSSCQKTTSVPRQQQVNCWGTRVGGFWTPPPSSPNTTEQTSHTRAYVHTLRRVFLRMCKLMSKTPVQRVYLHMHWCCRHLFSACHNKCKKYAYACASTPVRWCSCLFARAMETIMTVNHLETWVLPKKLSKFTPAHDAVAAVLSHMHHVIIHCDVGAGPIQLANGL